MSMEFLFSLFQDGGAFIQGHAVFFGTMALLYVVYPGFITTIFKKLEDAVNRIKFTVAGVSVDFSKFEWDDHLNHLLRDYVISLHGRASQIKSAVAAQEIDVVEGEKQLTGLTQEVVDWFTEKAPAHLKKYALDKFNGDKLLAAEFLFRRVQAIVYDVQNDKKKV